MDPIPVIDEEKSRKKARRLKVEDESPPSPVIVKIVSFMDRSFSLQVDAHYDTVLKLKEKIRDKGKAIEVRSTVLLHAKGRVLRDHQLLRDCHLTDINDDKSYVYLYERSPEAAANAGGGSEKLKLMLMLKKKKNAAREIALEVNGATKVSNLRLNNALPAGGHYCFSYKQYLMNECMPFEWHGIKQGDTIEISGV